MPESALTALYCSRCARECDAHRIQQQCTCGAPLLARYDLAAAARSLTPTSLAARPNNLWRFRELQPVQRDAAIVSLAEHASPILALPRAGKRVGLTHLYCKDEAVLPTGSFKARGAAMGLSRARELGVREIIMPTNGNAGVAWSAYAARAGMRATVVMPADAPAIYRRACHAFGARVFLVKGLLGDAGRIVARASARSNIFDASTMKEPYRIEGKKTLGFEIAEQFDWNLPDVIVYPTGGGVGLIGMHKALTELQAIGLLGARLPRFFAVQAAGCAPIVKAWHEGRDSSTPWEGAKTVAFGINVPKAIGDFLVLRILRDTRGEAIAVDDEAILEHQRMLANLEGLLVCPEGAAALAAVARGRGDELIGEDERVLIINTGSALPYFDSMKVGVSVPTPHFPELGPDDELDLSADV